MNIIDEIKELLDKYDTHMQQAINNERKQCFDLSQKVMSDCGSIVDNKLSALVSNIKKLERVIEDRDDVIREIGELNSQLSNRNGELEVLARRQGDMIRRFQDAMAKFQVAVYAEDKEGVL